MVSWIKYHFNGTYFRDFRYTDDTILMAESEEELKSLLMKEKESEKSGLKLNIQKTQIKVFCPHHFMANRWGNNGNGNRFYLLGLQNQCRLTDWLQVTAAMKLKDTCSLDEKLW